MNYLKVQELAELWGISDRRVRQLCAEGAFPGTIQDGRKYLIPENTPKPADRRKTQSPALSSKHSELLCTIDAKKHQLDQLRPLTEGELAYLREQFLVDFTYNSNAIEGNTLTLKETALVLEGMTIEQKPLKDHLEVVGHKEAFQFMEELAQHTTKLKERDIKDLHSLVLMHRPQDKGQYRQIPVRISGAYTQPALPDQIQEAIHTLIQEDQKRKRTLHPIERVALFHLEFEGIHPFIDGNGRTGRLLMNLELIRQGYLPINVKFTDRKRYYEAFDSYFRDHDSAPMVELVGGYVSERLDEYLQLLSY